MLKPVGLMHATNISTISLLVIVNLYIYIEMSTRILTLVYVKDVIYNIGISDEVPR